MELRHLRYFVAAAEELNISRAAARLHISQPPLSRQIRDLEQEIGTPLFDRGHKTLKLTSAGAYFLAEARKVLSHAQRAARLAQAAATGQAGKISIAFLSPLGGMFLPRIIRSFRHKLPLVDVDLHEMVLKQSDRAQSILDFVAAGMGISIVPEPFRRYKADFLLRELVPRPPSVSLCMAWRQNDQSPVLHSLRAMIRQYFGHRSREGTRARAG
jgi:DNA-binding transcriptional LysR family regulator